MHNFIIENDDDLKQNRFSNSSILHLAALNQERKHLNGAKKVIIFVSKDLYLETKWAIGQMDFDLIEMKRYFFDYSC